MRMSLPVELVLELPFATDGLPGVGGQLRASPEDFVVEEMPLYQPQGEGQHLYVNLTKVGLTSREVQKGLAQVFGVHPRDVGLAGMKDKHARTTQTFSLNLGYMADSVLEEAPARIQEALPVTVNWVQRHRNKLKRGHLLGNRFRIRIRELALPVDQALERAQAIVQAIRERGLPNFYGPQRLGRQGDNVRRGRAILQGEWRTRDRWLRQFLLVSYQSYLCNRYLARRLEEGLFDRILAGDVAKKHDTGGLFDVEDPEAEQPRYQRQEISFTAPMYGRKMRPAQAEAAELEARVLEEAGVELEELAQAGISGTRRLGRILVPDLAVAPVEGGLEVAFSLPKGAFATTVLREIMKVGYAELAHVPSGGEDE